MIKYFLKAEVCLLKRQKYFRKESVKKINLKKNISLTFKYNKKIHNMYKYDTLNNTFANQTHHWKTVPSKIDILHLMIVPGW